MIILPAIDLIDGACVRLTRGDYATSETVAGDPLETAMGFKAQGAVWLHMVDLDGAKAGRRVNDAVILRVAEHAGLKVEVGGGIREMADIAYYLERGVSRVILGSVALKDPQLVRSAVLRYGDAIAVGIDAKEGRVMTEGWLAGGQADYLDLAVRMAETGVATVIFTDIGRDGTLAGPNLDQLEAISQAAQLRIIASGGIRDLTDIRNLEALSLYGAICGKSVYKGTLELDAAVGMAGDQNA